MTAAVFIVLGLRLYTRIFVVKSVGADDHMYFWSAVSNHCALPVWPNGRAAFRAGYEILTQCIIIALPIILQPLPPSLSPLRVWSRSKHADSRRCRKGTHVGAGRTDIRHSGHGDEQDVASAVFAAHRCCTLASPHDLDYRRHSLLCVMLNGYSVLVPGV